VGAHIESNCGNWCVRKSATMNYCGRAKGFPLRAVAFIVGAPQNGAGVVQW
jgi:hypothetical protein